MDILNTVCIFKWSGMKWKFDLPKERHFMAEPPHSKLKQAIVEHNSCKEENRTLYNSCMNLQNCYSDAELMYTHCLWMVTKINVAKMWNNSKANSDSNYRITNLTKYKMVLDQTIPLSQCRLNAPRDSRVMFGWYTESGQMQLKREELWHLLCIGINISM